MNKYEGYIHSQGDLMVKKVPQWCDSIVDQSSPYVHKYLGCKVLPSMNQARQYFLQKNGGQKHVNITGLKKNGNN